MLAQWSTLNKSPFDTQKKVNPKWKQFSQPEIENQYCLSSDKAEKKFRFYLEGLQCSSCIHLVEELPGFEKEIIEARLNFAKGILTLRVKPTFLLGTACEMIEQLGYQPTPLKKESDLEILRNEEKLQDLKRIGVAGAIAGNLMLFSVPDYAGLAGTLKLNFQWLSFLIFLPLLIYVAQPFYRKSWVEIKQRRLSVDLMIVVALWAGFVFSSLSLMNDYGEIYFDSTASFIFLILLARYFLRTQQNRLLQTDIFSDIFKGEVFEVVEKHRAHFVLLDKVKKDDHLRLLRQQVLPCDGFLESEVCAFDLSFLTGESYPQIKHLGDKVLAGSRVLSADAILKAEASAAESHLATALRKISLNEENQNTIKNQSDLWSQYLTMIVFSLAALFFILTYQKLGNVEAFSRCLALITIACPCAIAFGTPLAFSLALRKAARNGFYIRSSSVFERLNRITKIAFDKTGTLTSSKLTLVKSEPAVLDDEVKSLILGLEKNSFHPVALSLKDIWAVTPIRCMPFVKEVVGQGVETFIEQENYKLSKDSTETDDGLLQVVFTVNDGLVAKLFFSETVQPEARGVIESCLAEKQSVMMLSGDRKSRAISVAAKVGIPVEETFFELTAEEKRKFIRENNPCLYVGDGLNDLLALKEAYASFAIKGSFESTLQVSDIYAPGKNLNAILEILALSKQVKKTVNGNLMFSVIYNILGGGLALFGLVNPLVAAVLMPISSVLMIGHTVWRLR
ncbi:MAG: heavy metal translocating P-type ATPase [Bdellovibrionota bacterium]